MSEPGPHTMGGSLALVITIWTASVGGIRNLGAQPRSSVPLEDIRRSLATVASNLPTFETEGFIYARWPRLHTRSEVAYLDGLSGLLEANYDSDRLVELLGDARPTVRTLVMALLFSKEDPQLLTHIARHLGDTAVTFPVRIPTANADPTRTAPQTVADVARAMLGAYMMAAGMKDWHAPGVEDWIDYNTKHWTRSYCLSWLTMRLARITGLQSPFPEERRPMLLAFRRDLDKIPTADRDLYLLWLRYSPGGGSELATDGELVDAGRRLGKQKLLQIVDGRPPGTDPDIPCALRSYQMVTSFILGHADQLFTRADEPFLAAIEQGQRDKIARGANAALAILGTTRQSCSRVGLVLL